MHLFERNATSDLFDGSAIKKLLARRIYLKFTM